jgi:RNA polymerase sigma-70 factor (ECF subfamily)
MTDPVAPSRSRQTASSAGAEVVSDGELLVAIAAGDNEAFSQLYARYSRAAFGLALGRLGDRGRAEDAVQDTFASVWRAASSYRPERGPGAPWLFTVARNAITSQWRRTRPEELGDLSDEASLELGPDEQAEGAWRSFCVHRSLEVLTAEQRKLIELAYWDGLSQSEIAARLELPLGTVKTRTRAALSRLAAALKEDLQ